MKPILFNTEMVRAILDGRKTVTRRVVKEPWYVDDEEVCRFSGMAMHRGCDYTHGMPYFDRPYHPGDILYVRETWAVHPCNDRLPPSIPCKKTETGKDCYIYRADAMNGKTPCGVYPEPHCWRPSIHMPKEAARLFGRVTGLRVQRVQDITDEEARREGAADREDFRRVWNRCYAKPRPVKGENGEIDHYESYPWEDIHETRAYRGKLWYVIGNPWVWVIEFERVTKEVAEEA